MNKWLREANLATHLSNITVDNITTCRELVQTGVGWAILPEIALKDFDGIKKKLYFKNGEPFIRKTYILCQAGAAKLSQIEKFIQMVTLLFRRLEYRKPGMPKKRKKHLRFSVMFMDRIRHSFARHALCRKVQNQLC